jgi:hypothetical protein
VGLKELIKIQKQKENKKPYRLPVLLKWRRQGKTWSWDPVSSPKEEKSTK